MCFRSITKILGDWWANQDNDEKTCYTDLAKQVNIFVTVPLLLSSLGISISISFYLFSPLSIFRRIFIFGIYLQYKDAFFSANPNFRWYKLPAPPLRTLNTRPGNADRPSYLNESFDSAYRSDDNQYRDSRADDLKRKARPSNVGIFKLADEAQMGGLSSLMVSFKPKSTNNNVGEDDPGKFPTHVYSLQKRNTNKCALQIQPVHKMNSKTNST